MSYVLSFTNEEDDTFLGLHVDTYVTESEDDSNLSQQGCFLE